MLRLLLLVHSLPPDEHTGTPLVTHGYARALASRGFAVTVVYPSPERTSWELAPERWDGESFDRVVTPFSPSADRWPVIAASEHGPADVASERAFVTLLGKLGPDVVHVVNNVRLPLSWPELAHARGIPVVRSVTCAEDLCGLIAPVSPRSGVDGYCPGPLTPDGCARCIEAEAASGGTVPIGASAQLLDHLRRKRARSVSQYRQVFDRILFATAGFRHYFESTLPLAPDKVRVIETGMDLAPWGDQEEHSAAPLPSAEPGEPVTFCLAALASAPKGLAAVTDTFTSPELLRRGDYRLVLAGGGDKRLAAPLLAANPKVSWHGPYRSGDLPRLLAGVDVGLSTSYFETFHRVTREYLLAGRPVIGSHAFGIPDIVRSGRNGLLFDHREPGSLTRAVLSVLDDRALLATLAAGARTTRVRSTDDEADELAALYRDLVAASRSAGGTDTSRAAGNPTAGAPRIGPPPSSPRPAR